MAAITSVQRPDYTYIGSETQVLQAMLDSYRSTLLWKCEGLDEDQLRQRSVTPSALSLLDLLRHLTEAERYWFQHCVAGRDLEPLYAITSDGYVGENDPTPAEQVVQRFLDACDESRRIAAARSLDEVVPCEAYGRQVSHRFIATHMVGEYARHCGHADLLRESIDGTVGE
jgi:hypothetical protein